MWEGGAVVDGWATARRRVEALPPLTVDVVGMFSRQCGDNGAALVLRPAQG